MSTLLSPKGALWPKNTPPKLPPGEKSWIRLWGLRGPISQKSQECIHVVPNPAKSVIKYRQCDVTRSPLEAGGPAPHFWADNVLISFKMGGIRTLL